MHNLFLQGMLRIAGFTGAGLNLPFIYESQKNPLAAFIYIMSRLAKEYGSHTHTGPPKASHFQENNHEQLRYLLKANGTHVFRKEKGKSEIPAMASGIFSIKRTMTMLLIFFLASLFFSLQFIPILFLHLHPIGVYRV